MLFDSVLYALHGLLLWYACGFVFVCTEKRTLRIGESKQLNDDLVQMSLLMHFSQPTKISVATTVLVDDRKYASPSIGPNDRISNANNRVSWLESRNMLHRQYNIHIKINSQWIYTRMYISRALSI